MKIGQINSGKLYINILICVFQMSWNQIWKNFRGKTLMETMKMMETWNMMEMRKKMETMKSQILHME